MALNAQSGRLLFAIGLLSTFLLVFCLDTAEAQINYSPGWGKRNGLVAERAHEEEMMTGSSPRGVNFSPGWGKRGMTGAAGPGLVLPQDLRDLPCKSTMDTILHIYKLVQAEAQKVANCEKFGSE
ncbi:red pigment-concentrating prohormone-like [Neocloeon triangulifer]|uniref:red pigment-concentrating prohormone-like n=1 Tax=Neocloeon triangulifer TaxID=2078957 RepID=UPI00286EFFAA|nr:red pigment-concentrating prohormone-like [Neocloeon triangulifer]